MTVPAELSHTVRMRAKGRCQYCLVHESLQGGTFHIEHVIPQSKGGRTELENLALACPGCNLHKASKTSAIDPITGDSVHLFHPIEQNWLQHFRFNGYNLERLTPVGRATIHALHLNHSRRQRIREVEQAFGLFPPTR